MCKEQLPKSIKAGIPESDLLLVNSLKNFKLIIGPSIDTLIIFDGSSVSILLLKCSRRLVWVEWSRYKDCKYLTLDLCSKAGFPIVGGCMGGGTTTHPLIFFNLPPPIKTGALHLKMKPIPPMKPEAPFHETIPRKAQ